MSPTTKTRPRSPGERADALNLQAQHLQASVDAIGPRLAAEHAEDALASATEALQAAGVDPVDPVAPLEARNIGDLRVQLIELRGEMHRQLEQHAKTQGGQA